MRHIAFVSSVIIAGLVLGSSNHFHSMWFGYLVMLVSLSLIFVGVKRYRDVEHGGIVGFGRALVVGLGIAVVAGVAYVAGYEAYVAISGYDFVTDYTAGTIADMQAHGATATEIAATQHELADMAEWYHTPGLAQFLLFLEIFPVGVVWALISAVALRNPRAFPARAT